MVNSIVVVVVVEGLESPGDPGGDEGDEAPEERIRIVPLDSQLSSDEERDEEGSLGTVGRPGHPRPRVVPTPWVEAWVKEDDSCWGPSPVEFRRGWRYDCAKQEVGVVYRSASWQFRDIPRNPTVRP